jgi:polysaccharide biosynthesis transport protein
MPHVDPVGTSRAQAASSGTAGFSRGPGTLMASPPAPAMTAGAILEALRRRWFVALCSSLLLTATTATALWFILQPSANVRALLYVATIPPSVTQTTRQDAGTGREDFGNYLKTQAALIKSRLALNAALKNPKVAELSIVREQADALEWLERELEVDNNLGPEILRITMNGDRPGELVLLLDSITEAYLKEIVNNEHNKRMDRVKQLEKLAGLKSDELQRKRAQFQNLAKTAGSHDAQGLGLAHKFALEQLNMAQTELMKCQSEILHLGVTLKVAPLQASVPVQAPVDEKVLRDEFTLTHQREMEKIQEKLELFKARAPHPESNLAYKSLCEQLAAKEKAIADHRKELAKLITEEREAKAKGELELNQVRQQQHVAVLQEMEKILVDQVKNLRVTAKTINEESIDIYAVKDEIAQMESLTTKIANELQALKVEIDAPPRVRPLEAASASQAKAEKRRYMGVGIGSVAALGLALFGVTWFELRARRITNSEEVIQGLGMRIVGSIPYLPDQNARQRAGEAAGLPAPYGQQLLTESIDATRTMLLHATQQDTLRIVMIASAVGGEGKTSLASHLAVSLAHAGRRTLLVDSDLRKPAVHRVFDIAPGPGLSEVLRGAAPLAEAVHVSEIDGLSLMPAGEADASTLRALAQSGLGPVFDQLRGQYDIIAVASCPVLPVADALLVAQHVDAVIFSILREVSRFPTVHAAWRRLESLGVRMLGAVVNGAREDHHGYSYYYSR